MGKDIMKLYSFRVPPKLINEYKKFCDENCMDVSKRIRKYMERDLENWRKIKKTKQIKEQNERAKLARLERERLEQEKLEQEKLNNDLDDQLDDENEEEDELFD
jgi:hypothetical protein